MEKGSTFNFTRVLTLSSKFNTTLLHGSVIQGVKLHKIITPSIFSTFLDFCLQDYYMPSVNKQTICLQKAPISNARIQFNLSAQQYSEIQLY